MIRSKNWVLAILCLGMVAIWQGSGRPAAAEPDARNAKTAALPGDVDLEANGLPAVLSWQDAELYRRIFASQQRGEMARADSLIELLEDRLLLGHVLAQRYLHPIAYRSRYGELRDWLADYADHPEAYRIHRLALKRKPESAAAPPEPKPSRASLTAPATRAIATYRSPRKRDEAELARVAKAKERIRDGVWDRRFTATKAYLESAAARKLLDPVEIDQGHAQIAAGWLYQGKTARAYEIAGEVADRSGHLVPIAHWTAGLAAWQLGDIARAAAHFSQLAKSDRVSSWNAAGGAYWAARAFGSIGDDEAREIWLTRAAGYPHTFYGLLARRSLGFALPFDFRAHRLTPGLVEVLFRAPEGRRAFALLQAGERERAGLELLRLGGWSKREVAEALLAVAEFAELPALSLRLASRLVNVERLKVTNGLDRALYPLPPWEPESGFDVDRALIFALMRKESRFDTRAMSVDGAYGLMQLMPRTAGFVAERDFVGKEKFKLLQPALNMDLGQRYIAHLLGHKQVDGDLFRLAAAYNGGPGNLGKWRRKMGGARDPLLFIETLPSLETRLFIERVLTNLWIYRARLGQPTPSLDAIAAGDWPRYEPLDRSHGLLVQKQNVTN